MIEQKLLTNNIIRPALRPDQREKYLIKSLRGIIIHCTGNQKPGAGVDEYYAHFNDKDNFLRTQDYESYHYIIEGDRVVQLIPDDELAYHAGDKIHQGMNQKKRFELLNQTEWDPGSSIPNFYTLSICLCVNPESSFKNTINSCALLVCDLLRKHGLKQKQIYRHFDITGRPDPVMFTLKGQLAGNFAWNTFQALVKAYGIKNDS